MKRARHWTRGAWQDLSVQLTDLGSRGLGLIVSREVQRGDRLSLEFSPGDGGPDLRVTLEIRHVRPDAAHWRAGGLFRTLTPVDHQRIVNILSDQTGP